MEGFGTHFIVEICKESIDRIVQLFEIAKELFDLARRKDALQLHVVHVQLFDHKQGKKQKKTRSEGETKRRGEKRERRERRERKREKREKANGFEERNVHQEASLGVDKLLNGTIQIASSNAFGTFVATGTSWTQRRRVGSRFSLGDRK